MVPTCGLAAMMKTQALLKQCFAILLFVLFLFLFGIPSFEKFLRRSTFIQKENAAHDFQLPAITVCITNKIKTGWKNGTWTLFDNVLKNECRGSDSIEEMLKCIKKKTYSLDETIDTRVFTSDAAKNLSSWTSDITFTSFGKCHTFSSLVSDEDGFQIKFAKRKKGEVTYHILFHDKDFIVFNTYPGIIPKAKITKEGKEGLLAVYISVKEKKM